MPNPYASTAGASTIAATVSGNDNLTSSPGNGNSPRPGAEAAPLSAREVAARLLTLIRPHRALLAVALVCSAVSIGLQLFVPILIGRAIDLIVGARRVDFAGLTPLLVRLAVVVTAAALLQWVQGCSVSRLSYVTVRDLRIQAHAKLSRVPISTIDTHPHGDLIARVITDVDQVGDGLLQGLTQLFAGVMTIVGTCGFMLSVSVPMALVVVVVTPASALAAAAMAKFASKSFAEQMAIQGRLTAYVEEHVGAQRLVTAFAYGERARAGFADINRELYGVGERAQFLSSLANPGTRFVNNLIYALVAAVGCIGVITGVPAALTVGEVQVFLSYATQYTKPFNEISGVVTQVQGAFASARRVFSLLDAVEEEPDAESLVATHAESDAESQAATHAEPDVSAAGRDAAMRPAAGASAAVNPDVTVGACPNAASGPDTHAAAAGKPLFPIPGADAGPSSAMGPVLRSAPAGEVELRHVDFSYTPDRPLLQDICLHARPGMRVALVGPTGCGKTTLINLLLRFYEVDAGEVLIDGAPVESYARADLRRRFGMVLQESWLFEGTVHENIAYGRAGATREQVERAARRAHADTFIRALPQGYDTVLPEDGGTLSQGQRQLLCIARVMLTDPEILLLDEATSSIDTRTELQVQAAFDELMRGRTSIVVAHRLSTIRSADCILAMRDGRIVERGTHEELLAANGLYAELYRSQFVATEPGVGMGAMG